MTDPKFSDLPSGNAELYRALPTQHVAAGCLFTDRDGRLLLVKPAYKHPWEIPGGGAEAGESPRDACRRELQEELGITHEPGPLLCVDFRHPVPGVRDAALRFVFAASTPVEEVLESFVQDPAELVDWRLVAVADLDGYVIPVMARRLRACLASNAPVYLEEGREPAAH